MTAESPAGLPAGHRDAAVAGRAGTAALRKPHQALAAIGRAAWDLQTCFWINATCISPAATSCPRHHPALRAVARRLRHSAVGLILVGRLSGRPGSVSWPWLSIWPMAVRG